MASGLHQRRSLDSTRLKVPQQFAYCDHALRWNTSSIIRLSWENVERVKGIEPSLSAWELHKIRAWYGVSPWWRRPVMAWIGPGWPGYDNGTLMARRGG